MNEFQILGLQNTLSDVTRYTLGVAWYIATFYVPALWVSHIMIFLLLLRRKNERGR